jgi:hypothetical protein
MIINGQLVFNNRNNSCGTKLFKPPKKILNVQSRNINNYNNNLLQSNNLQKGSLYSTKEATPRKEHNRVLTSIKPKDLNDPLDDSLSQISDILKTNKKNLNYNELIGKIPGISDEPNFIYDQILYNKTKINKAKKLSQKIGVLKLPVNNINNISTKETLSNSDRSKQYYSGRVKGIFYSNQKEKKNEDDSAEVSCCFFGRL